MNRAYKSWLMDLKAKINSAQSKAALQLNQSLLELYWEIGMELLQKQNEQGWGKSVVETLATDLQMAFPELKGFSSRNLFYMQRWVSFYQVSKTKLPQAVAVLKSDIRKNENGKVSKSNKSSTSLAHGSIEKLPQPVAVFQKLLFSVPWGHHRVIIDKLSDRDEASWYLNQTTKNNWSRNVLEFQIESDLYHRQIKASKTNNFNKTLSASQNLLAQQIFKDPYVFDFTALSSEAKEREIENALTEHISKFLLELGKGFAYVGKQYHLEIGGEDFYIDLLFYHLHLHCYVVFDLKTGKFEPEQAGKMIFYVNAIDGELKSELDQPTIGVILCKHKNKLITEYALQSIDRPIGVSQYKMTRSISKELQASLPTIADFEKALDFEPKSAASGKNKKRTTQVVKTKSTKMNKSTILNLKNSRNGPTKTSKTKSN